MRIYHYQIVSSGQAFTAKGWFMAFLMRCILVFKGYKFRYIGSYPYQDYLDKKAHEREIRRKFDETTFKSQVSVMSNRS